MGDSPIRLLLMGEPHVYGTEKHILRGRRYKYGQGGIVFLRVKSLLFTDRTENENEVPA